MDDMIYRQAALDALKAYATIGRCNGKSVEFKLVNDYADFVRKRIEALPSAQTECSLWFRVGEICVDESKGFISSGRAVEKIRELLREAEPYKGEES